MANNAKPKSTYLASVLIAGLITGTDHFVVYFDVYTSLSMPDLTLYIINHWHIDVLQDFGS